MNKNALIIFVKNPIAGKVKTRLAKDIGDTKAVEIYEKLLQHTHDIVNDVDADKYVLYGDYINQDDIWGEGFHKELQEGNDLGLRMLHAFEHLFEKEYNNIAIIGSDCYELSTDILKDAFEALKENDVVVGPTYDGGYYLLGMTQLQNQFFKNIEWSTDAVYDKTIELIKQKGCTYHVLKQLSDVDYLKDVPKNWL